MIRKGTVQKKVLLLLLAGLALSGTRSMKKQWKIFKEVRDEWREIDRRALERAINSLYKSKLVSQKPNKDGAVTFELSKDGMILALTYNIDNMEVKKHPWDGKWRIVISDIPERIKKVREAFRYHLKHLGFRELQKSVFVIPYECRNEVHYIVEFHNIRRFVRYIEAHRIDNELDLKHKFSLL